VQRPRDAHVSGENHYAIGASVHAWSATDHCRRRYGPSVDRKASLGRDRFRGKPASGLCTGQKFHLHDFSHIGEEILEIDKQPLRALSKLLLMPADIPEFIEDLLNVLALAKIIKT
jgi:hypothetical protein